MDSLDQIISKNEAAQKRKDSPKKAAFDRVYGTPAEYCLRHGVGQDGHLFYQQDFEKFCRAVAILDEVRSQEARR